MHLIDKLGGRGPVGEVILINGPPGVGKSSVSQCLALSVPGTVCVSGDAIRGFSPPDARTHLGPGSTYRAISALTRAYLDMGAPRVIAEYVFTRPSHVAQALDGLSPSVPVTVVTLWAELPAVLVRARERDRASVSPEAVERAWREIAAHLPELGEVICASGPVSETVSRVTEAVSRHSDRAHFPSSAAEHAAAADERRAGPPPVR